MHFLGFNPFWIWFEKYPSEFYNSMYVKCLNWHMLFRIDHIRCYLYHSKACQRKQYLQNLARACGHRGPYNRIAGENNSWLYFRQLQFNSITFISSNALSGLTALKYLWERWLIKKLGFPSWLPLLSIRSLYYNSITSIAVGAFTDLVSITFMWDRLFSVPCQIIY